MTHMAVLASLEGGEAWLRVCAGHRRIGLTDGLTMKEGKTSSAHVAKLRWRSLL
jgi:hypothetical protein